MRDAIGGVVNIQMILVFIAVVSGYLAFSVNYTKAVHVKDFIINKIEEYEASPSEDPSEVEKPIDSYMSRIGYSGTPSNNINASEVCNELGGGEYGDGKGEVQDSNVQNYIICKFSGAPTSRTVDGKDIEVPRYYYGVVTYITIDIPVINRIMASFPFFKVTGKTRLIETS